MRTLLDTSILIDAEGAALSQGDESAISIISIAELRLGVLVANDAVTRSTRLARLLDVQRLFDPIVVDEAVVDYYARIVAEARELGRKSKAFDALIGATAAAHDLVLLTRDRDLVGLPGVRVEIR